MGADMGAAVPWEPIPPASSAGPTQVRPREDLEQLAVLSLQQPLVLHDPLVGLMLGDYELQRCVGTGGMGLVYEGLQPLIGKRVAVKVLRPELANDAEQVARLLAEARAVNAIRHRGIIDIFGFGRLPDGRQYIVMEFLEGKALDARLAEAGRLPLEEALGIVDEVLAALGAAHDAGVVHRDLKPSNIFLVEQPDGSRYVKLLDFGLAKRGEVPRGMTPQTRMDMVVGTPEYMAPEQARGQAVGPMTDLYALGVLTFELVTGQLPFSGASAVDLLLQHVDAPPPRPSSLVPELTPALDAFVLQMLTKDPQQRPASAHALREQLQRVRLGAEQPTSTVHAVSAVPQAPRAGRRTRVLVGAAAAVLAVGAVGLGLAWRAQGAPAPAVAAAPSTRAMAAGEGTASAQHLRTAPASDDNTAKAAGPSAATPPGAGAADPRPATASNAAGLQPASTGGSVKRTRPAAAEVIAQAPAARAAPAQRSVPRAPAPKPEAGPSFSTLLARVEGLERDLAARAGSGEPLSPAAGTTLARLRREVELAREPSVRQELAGKLGDWERLFLGRH
ncbi:serine/threonine protein kinase [Aggregicoccus sp. 17bor-14]|uniref:serine/threonine-protein kinase n=1 Tax=Myxococcaceae TaxID=31 RepID=UPI00129C7F50|nr:MULTISPECIES: serine/threonine-protein kinase [Myxococcaceae]MBF5046428.1 serine/threonine protein kinase [Simulacricoccus sp. 17bor-14]MRI92147.1 serine/threonine protein kinase [Aggregicoccus sp. 17bor-14]